MCEGDFIFEDKFSKFEYRLFSICTEFLNHHIVHPLFKINTTKNEGGDSITNNSYIKRCLLYHYKRKCGVKNKIISTKMTNYSQGHKVSTYFFKIHLQKSTWQIDE